MNIGAVGIPQILTGATGRSVAPGPVARVADYAEVARNVPNLTGPDGKGLEDVTAKIEAKRTSGMERALRAEETRLGGVAQFTTMLQQRVEEVSSRNGGDLSDDDRNSLKTLTDTIDNQSRMMEASRQHIKELQEALAAQRLNPST